MKNIFRIYTKEDIENLVSKRSGETKFGEDVKTVRELNDLKTASAKYVLFGIPEDIGVRANNGIAGTAGAWKACLKALLNMQANNYTNPSNVIVLGEIDCKTEMEEATSINTSDAGYPQTLGRLVSEIDKKVSITVEAIVKAGKIPVIIGGGHNNSYGNIKGSSLALQNPVNAVNFDAHTDFRTLEHRHSGNGFSYAFEEGSLQKYFIFGLHKNYTSQHIFDVLHEKKLHIAYNFFEEIAVCKQKTFETAIAEAENFACGSRFGLEIDLDAVQGISSSATTPSGFSVNQARQFVHHFGKNKNVCYLHLCEAAPQEDGKQVGKLLAYLISDFITD